MRRILVLGVLVAALCFAAEAGASNGGDDGTNECGPYTTFNPNSNTGPGYQQFGYQSDGGFTSISANIKLVGYNANGSVNSQSFAGGWVSMDAGGSTGGSPTSEWLQAGIGAGGGIMGISQAAPYLYVEVRNGTVPGIGYVADNHYKVGNANQNANYAVTVHGAGGNYYVTFGSTRWPASGYVSYTESLINSASFDQFTTEEITDGGACPWAEFAFSSMNDEEASNQFGWPSDEGGWPTEQTWWLPRSKPTINSFDEWGNDCMFWTPPCESPQGATVVQSPVQPLATPTR